MKKILVFNGSPRKNGNTSAFLSSFIKGAQVNTDQVEEFFLQELELKYCTGCLRCNILKRCSLSDDIWAEISDKIAQSDVLVFGTPVYFHHMSAQMKKLIDRFRSFVHVQITETGLKHTPHHKWKKDFALLLPLGSSDDSDAMPVIELFRFIVGILGNENQLFFITGTRLAVANQVLKSRDELFMLYPKLNLPASWAEFDSEKNEKIVKDCYNLGVKLST